MPSGLVPETSVSVRRGVPAILSVWAVMSVIVALLLKLMVASACGKKNELLQLAAHS